MTRGRKYLLFIFDILLLIIAYYIALILRFESNIPEITLNATIRHLPYILTIKAIVFILAGLYRILWRYASVDEYIRVIAAVFVANLIADVYLLSTDSGIPRSIFAIVIILDMFFLGGIRIIERLLSTRSLRLVKGPHKRVLILGAGEAGVMVLREIRKNASLRSKVVAFIDDDTKKIGNSIHGVPVLGNRMQIQNIVNKYKVDEIIFAMPSATTEQRKDYLERASITGASVKTIPGVFELIDNRVHLSSIRDVSIEDLLGREPIQLDSKKLNQFINGHVIMITGGGGSIGSELARQIARYQPKELILIDIYENNVYEVQLELQKKYPDMKLTVLIDSVRNYERMRNLMFKYRPEIIFHAAAHKHVPLMEDSPQSAVLNNVFGTYNMVRLSHEIKTSKFVMISTDKAVNPTNIMGTTKRIGEMIVQAFDQISETEFVAVRFGNVLGSSGSVIPVFKQQIKDGGPVTVTHEDINRYFMTIPEACQLVLQAGAMANGGEIFILDMGEPVRIMDLAENLILLSGLEVGKDIEIVVTGLRPGEKLYEELLLDTSTAKKTDHNKIFIENPESIPLEDLEQRLSILRGIVSQDDRPVLVQFLTDLVPTYQPNSNGVSNEN